jgi:hypothetical protein
MEIGPATTYEAVTRQMVEHLAQDIAEIKSRVNGLLFMVAGSIIIDLLFRLGG